MAHGTRPQLGVLLSNFVPAIVPSMAALVDLAADLEEWGADVLALGEHAVWFTEMTHTTGEVVPRELMASMPETFVAYGAIAARTTRVRLLSTLLASARHPLVVARAAATLDATSNGRFDLGLAAGWCEPELAALGVPFEERFARLEETARACRALWDGDGPATFAGSHYSFRDVLPMPAPTRRVPIWFGASATRLMARRVVTWGDGWMTSVGITPDDVSRGVELLDHACAEHGRDRASIGVSVQLGGSFTPSRDASTEECIDTVWDGIGRLRARGATQVVVPLARLVRDRDQAGQVVTALAARLRTELPPNP